MPLVYSIATILLALVIWPLFLLHPKLSGGIGRRFGRYPLDFLAGKAGPRIWLHGASAGDLLALLPIYRELKRARPDAVFIVSTMTNSGESIAKSRFSDADATTFVPYDLPWVVTRAVLAI